MERAKNILVLLLEILLVLAVIIFITIYIWTSSTEKTYKQVIADIASGKYEKAAMQIKEIPHYKDVNDLSIYIYPISLFYKSYDNADQETNGYKVALETIKNVMPKLKNQTYKNHLSELEKVLKFRIEKLKVQTANLEQDKLFADIEAELKIGGIAEATAKINKLDKPSVGRVKSELLAYVSLLNAENLGDNQLALEGIKKLNPKYNGIMSSTIQQEVLKYVDSIEWNELYKADEVEVTERPFITLGMTREAVIALIGKPTSNMGINNKYGIYETAVFESFGTLYFEDNKLAAYKET